MSKSNQFTNATFSLRLHQTLVALSGVTTLILLGWLLYYSRYGLEFSDEGLYLNSIANPFAYSINFPPSLFGFVYHWPFQWADGDIAIVRMVNITFTFSLGWILCFLMIRRLWAAGWLDAAVLSAGIASLALAALQWRQTPNYNTLNVQSLFILMIGLLLADWPRRIGLAVGWILVGVGGWCCFMAKPTTAMATALLIMLYVVMLRRKSLLPMFGAAMVALALLVVTAYLIDGGVTGLVTRMLNSAEVETLLGSGHELSHIFRIDWIATSQSQFAISVLASKVLLLSILMWSRHKLLTSLVLAAGLIATIAIALLGTEPISIEPLTLFLVPAFTCLGAMFYRKGLILRTQTPTSIALALTFLVLPHLLALGSAYNYWIGGSRGALFWMLAAITFLSPLAQQKRGRATLLSLAVWAQLLTASVMNAGLLKPYRQIKDMRAYTAVTPLPGGGKLVLSQPFHDYLAAATAQARAAGLEVGTPVVDLSGRSPGLLYVLQTRALGLPWLIGVYPRSKAAETGMIEGLNPGSSAVAVETLGLENCADLAKAWVLIEPNGPRHLDQTSVMASFGAGQADYITAGTFKTPVNDGEFPNGYWQFLLKPVRPAALAEQSCLESRRQRHQRWSRQS